MTVAICGHEVLHGSQPHYCTYLSLTHLRALRWPNAATKGRRGFMGPEEQHFIAIHQMFETAFQVHIEELRRIVGAIRDGEYGVAAVLLCRPIKWTEFYGHLGAMLWMIEPGGFLQFRELITPASGTESESLRVIEILSGMDPERIYGVDHGRPLKYGEFLDRMPAESAEAPKSRLWTERLAQVAAEPNLGTVFDAALSGRDLEWLFSPCGDAALRSLAEALHQYDEGFSNFRWSRMYTASYQIAPNPETDPPSSFSFSESVLSRAHFFPRLWEFKKRPQALRASA